MVVEASGAQGGRRTDVGSSIPTEQKLDRSVWVAFYVAGVSALIIGLNITVMNVVFPSIEADFVEASRGTIAWGISGYAITLASLTLVGGWSADRFGRRRVFSLGLVTFAIGSAGAAVAPSIGWFITARLVQAVGAAMLSPASLSMVLPLFPTERKTMAISVWAAIGYMGSSLSPGFAAIVTDLSSWRTIFVLFALVSGLIALFAPRFLPADRDANTTARIDRLGAPAGTIGLGLAALAVVEGPKTNWSSVIIIVGLVAVVLLIAFAVRSLRHDAPLIELRMFRPRAVWSSITANLFMSAAGVSVWVVYPLFLVQRWGWSLTKIGVALTPIPLVAGISSIIGGRLVRVMSVRTIVTIGSLLPTCGMLLLVLRLNDTPDYLFGLLPGAMLFNVGFGLTFAPLNASALTGVPERLLGQANAGISTLRQLAGGLGVAVVVAVLGDAAEIPRKRFDTVFLILAATSAATAVVVTVFPPLRERPRPAVRRTR